MTQKHSASRLLVLAVFVVIALLLASRTAHASTTCSISSFFSFDSNDQITDVIHLDGRGLATCRGENGFVTETPVRADVEAVVTAPLANSGELTFSANSNAFTVANDQGTQIQDRFLVVGYPAAQRSLASPTVFVRGAEHGIAMQLNLSTKTKTFEKIAVKSVTFHFDESAPTLE